MQLRSLTALAAAAFVAASPARTRVSNDGPSVDDASATVWARQGLPTCPPTPILARGRAEIHGQPSTLGIDGGSSSPPNDTATATAAPFAFMVWEKEDWEISGWQARDGSKNNSVDASYRIELNSSGDKRFSTTMYRHLYYRYSYALACGLRDRLGRLWTLSRHGTVPPYGNGEPPWPPSEVDEAGTREPLREGWEAVFRGNRTMTCIGYVAYCIDDAMLLSLAADLESVTEIMADGSTAAGPTTALL